MKPAEHPRVYIMRDANGDPLYIGQSFNFAARVANHRHREWFPEVARIDLLPFDNIHEARAEERRLIREHKPPHNRMHAADKPDGERCSYWRSCGAQAKQYALLNSFQVTVRAVCEDHSVQRFGSGHTRLKDLYDTEAEARAAGKVRREAWLESRGKAAA